MKNKELFETVGEAGQIFAVGFDLTDLEDGTQDAEIRSYIEFNDITTNDAVKVIGDILGKFIHEASKKKDIRYAMAKTLIMRVLKSMDEDESKPEPEPETKRETKPETKPKRKSDDASLEKIAETLGSIKSLLEVMKTLKED
jgi:hypothetical protein